MSWHSTIRDDGRGSCEVHRQGADLRPERLIVGLKDDPLGAAIEALFAADRQAADWDVLPLRFLIQGLITTGLRP